MPQILCPGKTCRETTRKVKDACHKALGVTGAQSLCGTVGGAEAPLERNITHAFLSAIASDWPYDQEGSCQQEAPPAWSLPPVAIRSQGP